MFTRIHARTRLMTLAVGAAVWLTAGQTATSGPGSSSSVTVTSLGQSSPTFVGTAATGCASGCSLLSGPFPTPAVVAFNPVASSARVATTALLTTTGNLRPNRHSMPYPRAPQVAPDPPPPTVSCQPQGPGCDRIASSSGGAVGVKGIKAVDSGTLSTNPNGDIEPADQGLCAGNGYVLETNNVGEMLIFDSGLQRKSSVISLDTVMGLTARGWSSGGDPSCLYDHSNGGHWFITEFVSASPEAAGGTFAGCFTGAVPSSCYEGIAVSVGSSPFGPYNVYFLNANYNPNEPGYPFLLNDFTKIGATRDAFLVFYDEFPIGPLPGVGGGGFNGAQQYAINKNALEWGEPVTLSDGKPNPDFTVAIENMGTLPTPDGTCASDNATGAPGVTCWYQVIPAQAPDPSQYDNSHGGTGFMLEALDFVGVGDTRIAVFEWTGLEHLNSHGCASCSGIQFSGQLFSNVNYYYDPGIAAPQKAGPIPLGDSCGAAGLSTLASCPEGGVATNGTGFTQVSQAQGHLWGAMSTVISQSFASGTEAHMGVAYWVMDTGSFDRTGSAGLTSQGYISPAHEDLEMPAMAAGGGEDGNSQGDDVAAVITFTLSGNGGPTGADNGGFYPSTAFGRVGLNSNGLLGSRINIADLGQAPTDGFSEYQNYPGPTRPRWGDYSWAIYSNGRVYFATNYIQYPNCSDADFTLTLTTCGGTRDAFANWGTSVNYVVP